MPRAKREKCYVDGEFVATKDSRPVTDPYTGETIAECPVADDRLLDRAMDAAVRAFGPFAHLARDERSAMLHRISQAIGKQAEELAQLIRREGGKPIILARGEVARAQLVSRLAAEEAIRFGGEWLPGDICPGTRQYTTLVGRVPLGPTLAVSPFNFPLNLIMHKLAPAIAVGCPTIIKPSSETPLTALRLARICHDAGLPAGAVQVVPCPGPTFERLVRDDRAKMLSFTGSAAVGWHLNEIAGRKRVALELGGNAATVVHEDADLDFAANRIAFGAFAHAGQICISVQRIYIHEPIYDRFVRLLLKESRKVKSGDPADDGVIVGPMITAAEADRVESWVEEAVQAGAKVLLKGRRDGLVLKPTILADVPRGAKVYEGEVFGPVALVAPYATWDEALDLVNDSMYGLQASVFTSDLGRIREAYERLEVGAVVVNDIPTIRVDNYPYGGTKGSGHGREGVRCTMFEMTEERVLVLRV
jgi:acyl-CoA reductase-like NAD-dependent aldehyde dehydrogenase